MSGQMILTAPCIVGEFNEPAARVGFWAKMAAALGVTQLIIGGSCIVFHVVAYFINHDPTQQIHYMIEGGVTGGTIIGFLVISVLAGLFALFPMVLGVIGAAVSTEQNLMMPICQLVLATVEIIVATWSIGVSSQAICCPNSAFAQGASHLMNGIGLTEVVTNSNGQQVVIFRAAAPRQSMIYTRRQNNIPYVLQQGLSAIDLSRMRCPPTRSTQHFLFGPHANHYTALQPHGVIMPGGTLGSSSVESAATSEIPNENSAEEKK